MKKLSFILLLVLITIGTMAQNKELVLDRISKKLPEYQQAFPIEKIYVQTDKDIYSPGEIIWFNALVHSRSENAPGKVSSEITVNLYDASGKFITGDKHWHSNGNFYGDLKLTAEIPLGKYYLTAFTPNQTDPSQAFSKVVLVDQYYESDVELLLPATETIYEAGKEARIELKVNDFNGKPVDRFSMNYVLKHGDKIFAEGKTRSVSGLAVITALIPEKTGSTPVELMVTHPKNLWIKKQALRTTADELSLRFYVEGGNLLENNAQKIGFHATAWGGVPVLVEGDIFDQTGEIITKTVTQIPGFGLFPFKAEPGKKYVMKITGDYGKGQIFMLPQVSQNKIALSVSRTDNDFIYADIVKADTNPESVSMTVLKGYSLEWAALVDVTSSARVKIPLAELSTGVLQLSLFNSAGNLMANRLIYVPVKETKAFEISQEQTDSKQIKITVKPLSPTSEPIALQVAVADKFRKIEDGNSLADYFLVNSDLKNPAFGASSFLDKNSSRAAALDYILINNEIKGFDWNMILNFNPDQPTDNELKNFGVQGRVTDKKGIPVPAAKVSILNSRDMQMYNTTADPNGIFSFPFLNPVDVSDFNINASDEKGRGKYAVALSPTFTDKMSKTIPVINHQYNNLIVKREGLPSYLVSNPGLLTEQPAAKPLATGEGKQKNESYKTLLQTATNLLDVIKTMKPYNLMGGQIVFYGTINSINAQSGALIVVDGQKMGTQADVLSNISPYDVDKINISLDPMDIQKYTGLNNVGVIEITTKKGEFTPARSLSTETEQLYKDGYRVPRNILNSKVLNGSLSKDFRTTLYWNPVLQPEANGKYSFIIPLSEIKSDFVISVEGVSENGGIVGAEKVIRTK